MTTDLLREAKAMYAAEGVKSQVAGSLAFLGLPSLVQAILKSRTSGELILRDEDRERAISFVGGEMAHARSNGDDEGLGTFLLREGVLDWRQIEELEREASGEAELVALLLGRGIVTGTRLQHLTARHDIEIITSVFPWTSGSWELGPNPAGLRHSMVTVLPTADVVLRGVRHIRSWSRIRDAVGERDTEYVIADPLHDLAPTLDLTPEEWALVGSATRPIALAEMCRQSQLGDYAVCQMVWGLSILGALRRVDGVHEAAVADLVTSLESSRATGIRPLAESAGRPAPPPVELEVAPLAGQLSGVKLADLLRGLYAASRTGTLTATSGRITNRLYLSHGTIVAASSSAAEHRLSEILLRLEIVDESTLHDALRDCAPRPLGQYLLSQGRFEPAKLDRAVEIQLREILTPMFAWPAGRFVFEEGEPALARLPAPEMSTAEIILAGVRAMPGMAGVREFLDSVPGCFAPSRDLRLRYQRVRLRPAEYFLLSRIEGSMTFAELLGISPLVEEDTCRVLYGLLAAGLVELSEPGSTEASEPPIVPACHPHVGDDELVAETKRLESLDPYSLLGVSQRAGRGELRAALDEVAPHYHPDRGRTRAQKESLDILFARVVEAHRLLSDPAARRRYEALAAGAALEEIDAVNDAQLEPAPPDASRALWAETSARAHRRRHAEELFHAGVAAERGGDYTSAVRYLRQASHLDPRNVRYLEELGRSCSANPGWRRQAEEAFRQALEICPASVTALRGLADLYRLGGLRRRAEELYARVLAIEPGCEHSRAALRALRPSIGSTLGAAFRKVLGGNPQS